MLTMATLQCAASILSIAAAAAGPRTVNVAFVNLSRDCQPLIVTTPAGEAPVGMFCTGSFFNVPVYITDSARTIRISWRTDRQHGTFSIAPQTSDYLRVDIENLGTRGPYPVTGPVEAS